MQERVSVHLCTANRPDSLYGLLVSLRNQTFNDWDLVIVDDSDKSVLSIKTLQDIITRIRLEGHMVKYIKNPFPTHNIGINRNIAIENCPNKIGCRIDDDSVCEPDYLERLYKILKEGHENGHNVGAAGGIVPPFGHPRLVRKLPIIFNKITFHENGIEIADDGGYFYEPNEWRESHHLRSSFMYWNGAVRKAGMHGTEWGISGFREETDLSMRMIMAGYKLITDPGAICWHAQAPSGGARVPDYNERVTMNEAHFQRKFLRYVNLGKIKKGMFSEESK